MQTLYKPIYP